MLPDEPWKKSVQSHISIKFVDQLSKRNYKVTLLLSTGQPLPGWPNPSQHQAELLCLPTKSTPCKQQHCCSPIGGRRLQRDVHPVEPVRRGQDAGMGRRQRSARLAGDRLAGLRRRASRRDGWEGYRYKVPNIKVPNHKIPNNKVPDNDIPK